MEKYINDLADLNLGQKINGGSCSGIYEFSSGMYFKSLDEAYQDLTDPLNTEMLEVLKHLSEIKGMPYIVTATDIYLSKTTLFGYSMPIIPAEELQSISELTLLSDLLCGFKYLMKDVRTLSDNHVKTEDVGGRNILYNGFMYLLDLDLSLVDKRYIPDELYEKTTHSLLCGIREKVLGEARYEDHIAIEKLDSYFDSLKEACSEAINTEVKTIADMKKGYQKVKKHI